MIVSSSLFELCRIVPVWVITDVWLLLEAVSSFPAAQTQNNYIDTVLFAILFDQ